MKHTLKKLLLTTHVTFSVGWLGAAAAVLALAIAALGVSAELAHAHYRATEILWRAVVVPFAAAALVTGVVQGLVTKWGLARHWWVLAKLAITVVTVLVLLLHTRSLLPALAQAAADHRTGHSHGLPPALHLVIAAAGSLLLLLAATTLSVFKPWGRVGSR